MAVAGKFRSFEAAFGHVAILTNSVCEDEVSFGERRRRRRSMNWREVGILLESEAGGPKA